jgi:hypothetical protein
MSVALKREAIINQLAMINQCKPIRKPVFLKINLL